MPPRRRISNIAKLLPRKRTSTPERTQKTIPVHRDCSSLPAALGAELDETVIQTTQTFDLTENSFALDQRDLRVHRFAQRYESNPLPSYRDYPPVEEDEFAPSQNLVTNQSSLIHSTELKHDPFSEPETVQSHEQRTDCSHCSCDMSSLKEELSLLRENHQLLSETTRNTLRLAEALESRVESLQRAVTPSERLFWMLLDTLAAVVLFLVKLLMKPWIMARKWFIADRETRRRSWRLSVADFENDPFLGDVAKRLSFSALDD